MEAIWKEAADHDCRKSTLVLRIWLRSVNTLQATSTQLSPYIHPASTIRYHILSSSAHRRNVMCLPLIVMAEFGSSEQNYLRGYLRLAYTLC